MLGGGEKEGRRERVESAVALAEQVARIARDLTLGSNEAIAQLNGSMLSQQRVIGSYQQLLENANATIANLQQEISELKQANIETKRLEIECELRRAELALQQQKTIAVVNTLREVGGAVALQFLSARAGAQLPPGAVASTRPIEAIIVDVWPRLSAETIERLKSEAGTDLVFELLTRVTEQQAETVQQEEVRQ